MDWHRRKTHLPLTARQLNLLRADKQSPDLICQRGFEDCSVSFLALWHRSANYLEIRKLEKRTRCQDLPVHGYCPRKPHMPRLQSIKRIVFSLEQWPSHWRCAVSTWTAKRSTECWFNSEHARLLHTLCINVWKHPWYLNMVVSEPIALPRIFLSILCG